MENNRFDGFTRQLAQRENRRQAIKTLFAGGAGAAAALMIGKEATEAGKPPSTPTACCPADYPALCGFPGTCTATATDPNNCGGCNVTCSASQTCVAGVCTPPPAQCKKVSDCASSNTLCRTATTCKGGVCGYSYVSSGTPVGTQTTGNCQTQVCDGSGNIITVADSTDTPTPENECYIGTCTGTTPGQRPKIQGTICGDGKSRCDGNGNCVQCFTALDCTPGANECQVAVCDSGTCGISNITSGEPTTQQTSGDCLQSICDGIGGITTQPANDPPASTSVCIYQNTCSNGEIIPVYAPTTQTCNGGWCDGAGNCVTCNENQQCSPGPGTSSPLCKADHTCGYTCAPGFVACNGSPDCSVNLLSDVNNCGRCGNQCNLSNATATCNNGACVVAACNIGFGDCDRNPANGCETDLTTDFNCGTCGNHCGTNTTCINGVCAGPAPE